MSATDLGVRKLSLCLGVFGTDAVEFIRGLGDTALKLPDLGARLIATARQLIDLGTRLVNRSSSLLPASSDALAFGIASVERLLEPADLGKERAFLALETCDISRRLCIESAGILNCPVCLGDLLDRMVENCRKVGLDALELANATFALKRARRILRARSDAQDAARMHAGAIGGDVHDIGKRGGRKRNVEGIDDVIAPEDGSDDRTEALFDLAAIHQPISRGTRVRGRRGDITREDEGLTRGIGMLERDGAGMAERIGIFYQKRIDIGGEQLLDKGFKILRNLDHVAQAADDAIVARGGDARGKRRGVAQTLVELCQAREL